MESLRRPLDCDTLHLTAMRRSYFLGWLLVLQLGLLQLGPLGCGDCDVEVTTNALPNATVGVAYNVGLGSKCGGDAWYLADGQLPPGIGLIQEGFLRGLPTVSGTYNFVVEVVDFDSGYVADAAFKGLSLTVNDPTTPPPTPSPTPTAPVA